MSAENFQPAYLKLAERGELARRAAQAKQHLEACDLCAWTCGINRNRGRLGQCKTATRVRVSSFFPHMGEEDPLRGTHGSGTIFFGLCNLKCVYCQNHDISQQPNGDKVDVPVIAEMMLQLQRMGCHNINFVSPSHVVAQIIGAVAIAVEDGLNLPLVYNTGGYDSLEALALLNGIIDIYMPDIKYADPRIARQHSKIPDYPARSQKAIKAMHRQVGDLVIDENGIAQRGLLVRHLVLPGGLAGMAEIARFLAEEISPDTYINIMGQYRPAYLASQNDYGPLSRRVRTEEIQEAYDLARAAGLHRFDERHQHLFLF